MRIDCTWRCWANLLSPEREISLWIKQKKNVFVESLDQFRGLEVHEGVRNVFVMSLRLSEKKVLAWPNARNISTQHLATLLGTTCCIRLATLLQYVVGINQRWNDIWNGSYMTCGYEFKWSYDPRSCKRNFCNCVEKPEKFRTSKGCEPWFKSPLRGSYSFTCFHIRRSYMTHFIYHFIVDSFLSGTLEPTNDQLSTSVAS